MNRRGFVTTLTGTMLFGCSRNNDYARIAILSNKGVYEERLFHELKCGSIFKFIDRDCPNFMRRKVYTVVSHGCSQDSDGIPTVNVIEILDGKIVRNKI